FISLPHLRTRGRSTAIRCPPNARRPFAVPQRFGSSGEPYLVRRTAECFLLLAENLSTREHPLLDHEGLQVATDESDQRQVRLFILRSVRARLLGTFLHGGSFRFCTSDSLGGELNRHFYSLIINRLRDIPKKTVATFYPGFFTQKLWV